MIKCLSTVVFFKNLISGDIWRTALYTYHQTENPTSPVFRYNCHNCCLIPHPQRRTKIGSYHEQTRTSWIVLPRKPSSRHGYLCCWIRLSNSSPQRSMKESCDLWRALLGSSLDNLNNIEESQTSHYSCLVGLCEYL